MNPLSPSVKKKLDIRKDIEIEILKKQIKDLNDRVYDLTIKLYHAKTGFPKRSIQGKKLGISAEPTDSPDTSLETPEMHQTFPKTPDINQLIRVGIAENEFLKNLSESIVDEIVECMVPLEFRVHQWIIEEGEPGSLLYILEQGQVDVTKLGVFLKTLVPGQLFGELAILYSVTRTASVQCMAPSKVWVLDRLKFQNIVRKHAVLKQREYLAFLKTIDNFKDLPNDVLKRVADVLHEEEYKTGEYIIKEGTKGNTFYIISSGDVDVTQGTVPHEVYLRTLGPGDFFGEIALERQELRSANVRARPPKVKVLTLQRDIFIATLSTNLRRDTLTQVDGPSIRQFLDIKLGDIKFVKLLGVGGYGRVHLVTLKHKRNRAYAMKQMSKHVILTAKQTRHVKNEKSILETVDNPFIVNIYATFQDKDNIYMLLDVCLGGDLWTRLRDMGHFDEDATRFYMSNVMEALEYLHSKGIVYRDLKPENLLICADGYLKLVDFGFAKKIGREKTYTFCGTTEYMPPEVILNKGHDLSADIWALGILIYELMTGLPPFMSHDPMVTYNLILKGMRHLHFSPLIPQLVRELILDLCREAPFERLGVNLGGLDAIREHAWFTGVIWTDVSIRKIEPPYIPTIKNPTDTSNFDEIAKEDPSSNSENSDKHRRRKKCGCFRSYCCCGGSRQRKLSEDTQLDSDRDFDDF